jgi:signal peptidase II
VAIADLATKWLAERRLDEPVSLLAGVRLELGHNSGIAFGALNDVPSWMLIVGVTAMIGALLVAVGRGLLSLPWPAVGLLIGGALANLADRVGDGRVTDFIDPPRWPAFNLADVAITCAVLLILWSSRLPSDRRAGAPSARPDSRVRAP